MIFDRTQNDVDTAIRIRAEKVQTFAELTDADVTALERGTITINTLNRVEEKQEELKNIFNDMGYWNTPIINKAWDATQIFDVDDLERIFSNTEVLKQAFYEYKSTPKTPTARYHYQNINDIEKILYDLDKMIEDVKSRFRECGTFECGEDE